MGFVEQAAHDGGAIVLDLSQLEYVSSAGLRCFMLASRQAKAQHGRIFVASLQPMVAEIFEISHFNLVFQVFPSVREALGAVSTEAASAFEKA
jgi:anti-anti-sigma factor